MTSRRPAVLLSALVVAGVAALLLATGAVMPVVAGGQPGFSSGPLLITLALVPIAGATFLLIRRKPLTAAGVLVGIAVPAPARVVLDLQFLADSSVVARPELYLPDDLAVHGPASGLWLLLAGHAAVLIAGVLALRTADRLTATGAGVSISGKNTGRAPEESTVQRWRQRWLFIVVFTTVVAACGLLMAPYGSDDVYLLARHAFEGPAVELAGSLLLACLLPLGGALLMTSSAAADFTRGGLAGLAWGVTVLAAPDVAAGAGIEAASVSGGPVVALVAAAVLLAVAATRPRQRAEQGSAHDAGSARSRELSVPSVRRLYVVTGVLAVFTAAVAAIGACTAQLSTAGSVPAPESPVRWLLLTAGVLVGVLGLALFLPSLAGLVRPVLSIVWAGVLIAGTAVLDTAITATSVPSWLSTGPGVLWTWLAMCAALMTACCSMVTGLVEGEDDESGSGGIRPLTRTGMNMLIPLTAGALLSAGAFSQPVATAPGYAESGVWPNFGTPSWGLIVGLVTVLSALARAPRVRPLHAAALLVGVVCLLGLRAVTLPLIREHIDDAGAGIGLWLALAGVVAVVIATVIAVVNGIGSDSTKHRQAQSLSG